MYKAVCFGIGERTYSYFESYHFIIIWLFSAVDIIQTYMKSKRELKRLQQHSTWDHFYFPRTYNYTLKERNYDTLFPVKSFKFDCYVSRSFFWLA